MIPLKLFSKIFPNEDEFVLPEYRVQRRINKIRIPEIKKYILIYVFFTLLSSIDGEVRFILYKNSNIRNLEINMNSTFLINNEQHRKVAIEVAIKEDPSLKKETISIIFVGDEGVVEINKHLQI